MYSPILLFGKLAQGEPRCHIRYHRMFYDDANTVVYQTTKSGICLNHQQLCHLAHNISILLSEMNPQNKDHVPPVIHTPMVDNMLDDTTSTHNIGMNMVDPSLSGTDELMRPTPSAPRKRKSKSDTRSYLNNINVI